MGRVLAALILGNVQIVLWFNKGVLFVTIFVLQAVLGFICKSQAKHSNRFNLMIRDGHLKP